MEAPYIADASAINALSLKKDNYINNYLNNYTYNAGVFFMFIFKNKFVQFGKVQLDVRGEVNVVDRLPSAGLCV